MEEGSYQGGSLVCLLIQLHMQIEMISQQVTLLSEELFLLNMTGHRSRSHPIVNLSINLGEEIKNTFESHKALIDVFSLIASEIRTKCSKNLDAISS